MVAIHFDARGIVPKGMRAAVGLAADAGAAPAAYVGDVGQSGYCRPVREAAGSRITTSWWFASTSVSAATEVPPRESGAVVPAGGASGVPAADVDDSRGSLAEYEQKGHVRKA